MHGYITITNDMEGHITTDLFHNVTQGKVSNARLIELIKGNILRAYEMNGDFIIDIGSVRNWLKSVHPVTLEPIKWDLF
jgi:hypothetical protein